jgi:hypothetical protein
VSPDDASNQRNELVAPILDAADGMKADMERRGWSPTAAETVALQWLIGAMGAVWKGAQ